MAKPKLEFIFAYDLGIISFGSYFIGELMNVGVEAGFRATGVIPIQLIKLIAPMAEFKQENYLIISFILRLTLLLMKLEAFLDAFGC